MKQIKKSVLKQGFFQSTINFNDAMSELSCGFRFSYTEYHCIRTKKQFNAFYDQKPN